MLAPLNVSRAICCGRAAYLCYQSPALNIMTKQNSKNNIHPAVLQMHKADKLFIYYQLNKLGLSGGVCKIKPLGGGCLERMLFAGGAGRDGELPGAPPAMPPWAEPAPGCPVQWVPHKGQRFHPRSEPQSLISCDAAAIDC